MSFLNTLNQRLTRLLELPELHAIEGISVEILNTRRDINSDLALSRLTEALRVIKRAEPRIFKRLQRDIRHIAIQRFPCRGAFFPDTRICLTELTFLVKPEHSINQIASSILHESIHARIYKNTGRRPPVLAGWMNAQGVYRASFLRANPVNCHYDNAPEFPV